jgi:hypothetical protein
MERGLQHHALSGGSAVETPSRSAFTHARPVTGIDAGLFRDTLEVILHTLVEL